MYHNLYKSLIWDSSFFGYKVAQIITSDISAADLLNLLGYLKLNQFRLVYWYINPESISQNQLARKYGGTWIDEKVTYRKHLSNTNNRAANSYISSFSDSSITAELEQLSLQSGAYSRFKRDPNFQNQEFERLYKIWPLKFLENSPGRNLLVYQQQHKIYGFIAIESQTQTGSISLLAVNESVRRRGIGQQLLQEAFRKFQIWNCLEVQVNTQKLNQAACKFYEKNKFEITQIQNIYHFWL